MLTDLVDDVEALILSNLDPAELARVAQVSTAARALAAQEQAKRVTLDFPEYSQLAENSNQSALKTYGIFKQASKLFTPNDYRLVKKHFPDCTWEQVISFFQLAYAEVPNINSAILIIIKLIQAHEGKPGVPKKNKLLLNNFMHYFNDKSQNMVHLLLNETNEQRPFADCIINLPRSILRENSVFRTALLDTISPHLINLVLDKPADLFSLTINFDATHDQTQGVLISLPTSDITQNVYEDLYTKVREHHPKPPACHPLFTAGW